MLVTVNTKATIKFFACVVLIQYLDYNYVDGQGTRVMRKSCLLKPETGPCRGNIKMFYFDPKEGSCKRFVWGGCQGNGNRFDSNEECLNDCVRNFTDLGKTRPRYCFLNFDYGFCFGSVKRYYYDPLWKVCKERLYSGCGGNKNNFYNIEQCDSVCRYGNGFIKASKMKKEELKKIALVDSPGKDSKKHDNRRQSGGSTVGVVDP